MKKLLSLVCAFILGVGLLLGGAVPAQAASIHSVVIKNHKSSVVDLEICHNWGNTRCYEGYWYLDQGKNSKTGSGSPHWSDADGYYIPYGMWAKVGSKRIYTDGWHKLGGCGGCTITIRLYRD